MGRGESIAVALLLIAGTMAPWTIGILACIWGLGFVWGLVLQTLREDSKQQGEQK